MREDGRIPFLILVNGRPGIGKSTLVRRYVDDHPLALNVDVDAIRTSMGQWADFTESMILARNLGTAMARLHLTAGHDVVIPQVVARVGIDQRALVTIERTDRPIVHGSTIERMRSSAIWSHSVRVGR